MGEEAVPGLKEWALPGLKLVPQEACQASGSGLHVPFLAQSCHPQVLASGAGSAAAGDAKNPQARLDPTSLC